MIFTYTQEERKQLEELERSFDRQAEELDDRLAELRPDDPEPPEAPRPRRWTAKAEADYHAEAVRLYEEWIAKGSPEWAAVREARSRLIGERIDARRRLLDQFERRAFSELPGGREGLLESARDQASRIISTRFNQYQRQANGDGADPDVTRFSARDLRSGPDQIYLDAETMIEDIREELHLHYEALADDPGALEELGRITVEIVESSPYTSRDYGELGGYVQVKGREIVVVRSTRPQSFLTPIDKLTNSAFEGPPNRKRLRMSSKNRSRNPVYTMYAIDFINLTLDGVTIEGEEKLTNFDRVVHDAIVTLYVEGGNEYITLSMIYQVITGNFDDHVHLSEKQKRAISNSITKLMRCHIIIDATKEAELYGYKSKDSKYDGMLIVAERATNVELNGVLTEVIHIFRSPILYNLAAYKNQIGRLDIRLLNTTLKKNEETIILQDYLYRRILSMKGTPKLSRVILYDTIYDHLKLQAATDGALRKKKKDVRDKVKTILSEWSAPQEGQSWINGFSENTDRNDKNRTLSVAIDL